MSVKYSDRSIIGPINQLRSISDSSAYRISNPITGRLMI